MRVAIRTTLLALFLGMVTTIVVAEAFAYWRDADAPITTGFSSAGGSACAWMVSISETEGVWLAEGMLASDRYRGVPPDQIARLLKQSTISMDRWPFSDCAVSQPGSTAYAKRCGWPWLAMQGGVVTGFSPMTGRPDVLASRGCIAWWSDPSAGGLGHGRMVMLPWTPVWPGFIFDSLLFGAVWAALLMVAMQVRRRVEALTPRRAVWLGATCLVLGFISTLAAALACALLVNAHADRGPGDVTGQTFQGPGYRVWWLSLEREPGAMRATSRWIAGGDEIGFNGIPPNPSAEQCVPTWAPFLYPRPDVDLDHVQVVADARGWPVPAFGGGFETIRSDGQNAAAPHIARTFYAIALPRFDSNGNVNATLTRLIPLRPLWPGLAIDVLVFTAAWSVLLIALLGPGVLRRSFRRHRGACIACGYDLRGSPSERCPECGEKR